MSYADIDSLKAGLGSLFAEIYPSDSIAEEDLADAQAEIDGALAARYEIPVSSPAETLRLLKGWTLALAEELAFLRTAGAAIPEKIRLRAEEIRRHLAGIRQGSFLLPGTEERHSEPFVFLSMDSPVFGRDKMKRY